MEKMKTLTIGGVTYAVCAPLTEEEKQEVTGRVLEGISYEDILAPHKQEITDAAGAAVKADLDIDTRTLAEKDFAIGRIVKTNWGFDHNSTNAVATPAFLECTADAPYSMAVNSGNVSNVTVIYYADDEILDSVTGLKTNIANLCNFSSFNKNATLAERRNDITHIRIMISYPSANGAVTADNFQQVVSQFTFTRKYTDPYVRQSKLTEQLADELGAVQAEMDSVQQQLDRCAGKNFIYALAEAKEQDGLTVTPDPHVPGKYTLTGTRPSGNFAIYSDMKKLPEGILKGHTYRIGKRFPLGVRMEVLTYDGAAWTIHGSINNGKPTTDIVVPDNAVGMSIRLGFTSSYVPNGDVVETEMISASSGKYWAEKHHPDVVPPPMLTIIDDDGCIGFKNHLLPIIEDKKIPIASAVPVSLIEKDDEKRAGINMTWGEIEECALSGAEILSHTYGHIGKLEVDALKKDENGNNVRDLDKDPMTLEQIAHDYRLAQAHLRNHGINSEGLAFVGDSSNVDRCVTAWEQVSTYGFKTDCRHGGDPVINHKGGTDRYGIKRNGATFYDADALKLMIDSLKQAGTGWLVLMLHTSSNKGYPHKVSEDADTGKAMIVEDTSTEVRWADWTPALEEAIQYAITNGIQIVNTECGVRTYCD